MEQIRSKGGERKGYPLLKTPFQIIDAVNLLLNTCCIKMILLKNYRISS
jgi:hypothetical protein